MVLKGTESCLWDLKEYLCGVISKLSRPELSYEMMIPRLPVSNEVGIFTVPDLCSKGVRTVLIKVSVLKLGFR